MSNRGANGGADDPHSPGSGLNTFGPNVLDRKRHRVAYDLRWYYPTSTHQDGRATTHPTYYKEKFPDVPDFLTMDYCFGVD